MADESPIQKGKVLTAELACICRELSDTEIGDLFGNGTMDELLNAVFDPTKVGEYPTIADFFLANKTRASLVAAIRTAITRSCSFEGKSQKGTTGYASPNDLQWFNDGVMLLEGPKPFEGLLGLYRNGRMSYAVTARNAQPGDNLGPDDFHFVDSAEVDKLLNSAQVPDGHNLDTPAHDLRALLNAFESNESKYQTLFQQNPWVLGLQYKHVQRHENLDDQNIPDFTAVRVHDSCRDIFEINPPSMVVFRADGEFTADFNSAWNQAERYLNFAREEADYLRRK